MHENIPPGWFGLFFVGEGRAMIPSEAGRKSSLRAVMALRNLDLPVLLEDGAEANFAQLRQDCEVARRRGLLVSVEPPCAFDVAAIAGTESVP